MVTTTTESDTRAGADLPLLGLLRLASPALPVGGFSYSEVLEAAVDAALVTDELSAAEWLSAQLHVAQARSDLPVVAAAVVAWRDADHVRIHALNDWVLQTRETAELRLQTEQMGRSLALWLINDGLDDAARALLERIDPSYPVAFALAAALTQAEPRACALAYGFSWAENMVQAALKAIPLGQRAGQRVLARLMHEIPAAVNAGLTRPAELRQAYTPMLAILSARHEIQYSRLFRS